MNPGRFLTLAVLVFGGAATSAVGAGKSADAIFQEIGTTSPQTRSAEDRHHAHAHARRAELIAELRTSYANDLRLPRLLPTRWADLIAIN